jgi:hypothetical protein
MSGSSICCFSGRWGHMPDVWLRAGAGLSRFLRVVSTRSAFSSSDPP